MTKVYSVSHRQQLSGVTSVTLAIQSLGVARVALEALVGMLPDEHPGDPGAGPGMPVAGDTTKRIST